MLISDQLYFSARVLITGHIRKTSLQNGLEKTNKAAKIGKKTNNAAKNGKKQQSCKNWQKTTKQQKIGKTNKAGKIGKAVA